MKKLFFLFAVIVSFVALARNRSSISFIKTNIDSTPVYEMKQYWLVLLFRGQQRSQDSISAAKIQQAHMNNIERLASEGKIIMAGPMGDKGDLRGIFIMDGKDSTEIASHIKVDSAIVTGRLRFEIHPWWTAKGKYEFK
jgi:uncharacterized protein YciI